MEEAVARQRWRLEMPMRRRHRPQRTAEPLLPIQQPLEDATVLPIATQSRRRIMVWRSATREPMHAVVETAWLSPIARVWRARSGVETSATATQGHTEASVVWPTADPIPRH